MSELTRTLLQKYPHRVRYEHPLNERTRVYLRVEYLLKQVKQNMLLEQEWQHQVLLKGLFELLEIFSQSQIKSDLIKGLGQHKAKLNKWMGLNNVNQDVLRNLLDQINQATDVLHRLSRLDEAFNNDRLLSNVRQRISIPGGCCSFDLPMLHCWLAKSPAEKQHNTSLWWNALVPIYDALTLLLRLTRESGPFVFVQAKKTFYQDDTQNAEMLRLEIPKEFNVYPVISGNKSRYVIRFTPFNDEEVTMENIEFRLAVCH